MPINEATTGNDSVAITGSASSGERTIGIQGNGDSVGVRGVGKAWHGIEGQSQSAVGGFGVFGINTAAAPHGSGGVGGESKNGIGVYGKSESTTGGAGVVGENSRGAGVIGKSKSWVGVYGESEKTAVWGKSKTWIGVHGKTESTSDTGAGVMGEAVVGNGVAVYGKGGRLAGYFEGAVEITGDLTIKGVSIQSILTRIQYLEQKVGSGSGVTPQDSYISCSLEPDAAGSLLKLLRVKGTDFKGGEEVRLKITSTKEGENPVTETHQTTATPNGTIDFRHGNGFCGGEHITFQVQGTGLTSNKVSKVATTGC